MNAKLMKIRENKKKGFTLVELIIVIAIIAILAAMAIPKFGAVRLDARISNDIAAAKNIQSAAAVLLSNGTYAETVTIDDASLDTNLTARIDGTVKPKAGDGTGTYQIVITKGNIEVKAYGVTLAPATDSTAKDYRVKVQ